MKYLLMAEHDVIDVFDTEEEARKEQKEYVQALSGGSDEKTLDRAESVRVRKEWTVTEDDGSVFELTNYLHGASVFFEYTEEAVHVCLLDKTAYPGPVVEGTGYKCKDEKTAVQYALSLVLHMEEYLSEWRDSEEYKNTRDEMDERQEEIAMSLPNREMVL